MKHYPDLSIVIPTYTINQDLEGKAADAILSMQEQLAISEIIVTEDGGFFSPWLYDVADIYIRSKSNTGFSANVNRGWKLATGDYVAIVNSDVVLRKGDLSDLCIPGKVTCPKLVNEEVEHLTGVFWVAPKEVTEEYGMLNEEMKNFCSDADYDHRVRDIFQQVDSVEVFHHLSSTIKAAGLDSQREADQKIYERLKKNGEAT